MKDKVNILIVDDHPDGVLAVQAVLTSADYNLVTAASGNEALKYLLNDDFAVILLDVQMPGMSGFETASVIKTRDKCKDIPIIFMSAVNQDEQYVYEGYEVGAVDYIMKPFDPYILRSKVAIFVDIYRKNRLVRTQALKLRETEIRDHAKEIDRIELENLKRYRNLADSLPQIVFRLTHDGQSEYFNRVWYDYTGLSVNKSSGFLWKDVVHPEDLPNVESLFKFSNPLESSAAECRVLSKYGDFKWHVFRIQQEDFAIGSESHWLGTAANIEERKMNEERQRFLAEAGELLISTLDLKAGLEDMAELAVPFLADWIVFDIHNDEDEFEVAAIHHRSQSRLTNVKDFYEKFLCHSDSKHGREVVLKLNKKQVLITDEFESRNVIMLPLGHHETVTGVMTIGLDNSGRKYTQEIIDVAEELSKRISLAMENARLYKLSQASIQIRNEFLSIASHELNTPITSLKLQLQMVLKSLQKNQDEMIPADKFLKSMDISIKQVNRLINLVKILLDVSRIQSGRFTYCFEDIQVMDVINEVVERHMEILKSSNCEITVGDFIDQKVKWDKTRVEQVLTNLLTNAIKYAPGRIEISLKETEDDIAISVRDFGQGIPKNKLKTIFERFERVNINTEVSGLGLGLFIVKQIAEGHHGRVEVESEEHKGTVFTIHLPKVVEEANVSHLGSKNEPNEIQPQQ